MKLAKMVKSRRLQCGMTLAQVAKKAKVSVTYLSQIERGDRIPAQPITLSTIANVLALNEPELIIASKEDRINVKRNKCGLDQLPQSPSKTLRDEFAMAAMQGLLANPGGPIQANPMSGWGFCNSNLIDLAKEAFAIADAMLTEREKHA